MKEVKNNKTVLSQGNRAIPVHSCSFQFKVRLRHSLQVYIYKSSQASKARLQSSKHSGAKQNLTQNGHSRSRVLESVERQ